MLILILAIGVLAVDLILPQDEESNAPFLMSWLGLASIAVILITQTPPPGDYMVGFGTYTINGISTIMKLLFTLACLFSILLSKSYFTAGGNLRGKMNRHSEFMALMIFCTFGMYTVASAGDMISLFVGIELSTIPLYILSSFYKDDRSSTEAAIKYIVMGSVSTAIGLFGFSFIYGAVGYVGFEDITNFVVNNPRDPFIWIGFILILSSLGFKLGLAPFHMWAPDVYQGAPTPVTTFLSVGSKSVAVTALMLLIYGPLSAIHQETNTLLIVLACLSMVIGNLGAMRQKELRRFMAYSSIAQAGYILVGFLGKGEFAQSSIIFYLFVFMFTNVCTFFIFSIIGQKRTESFSSLRGLSKEKPMLAALLMMCMFSLAGIPPFAGFTGKFILFASAAKEGYYWMVLVGALNSTVSLYYYLLIIKEAYINKPDENQPPLHLNTLQKINLSILGTGVVLIGLIPIFYNRVSELVNLS